MWPETCTRVVFLVTRTPTMDGVNTVLRSLGAELTARGVTVEYVSLHPGTGDPLGPTRVVERHEAWHRGPVLRGRRSGWGMAWSRLPLLVAKRIDRRVSNRRFRRMIEAYGPETALVFTNVWLKTRLDETGYRRTRHGPVFIGQHHSSFASVAAFPPGAEETRLHFADLDAFVALTQEDADGFAMLLPGVRCVAIGNPLPSGDFPASSREPIAIAIGRYSPEKQLDLMIDVFREATAIPELAHWQLHLYGEGSLRHQLEAKIQSERVGLKGRVDDVSKATRTASVHLLTSAFEGWGMCIAEAALSGVPTVAFDCAPGVRALMPPSGRTLVPPGDSDGFARALRAALIDQDGLRRQGEEARIHVQRFAPGATVELWADLVASCLEGPR